MERYEEMMLLSRQLEFPQSIKPVPIISSARWLVRSGALTQLIWRNDDAKLTFGRKVNKISVHLFLFTDILVVTKRKRSVESKRFVCVSHILLKAFISVIYIFVEYTLITVLMVLVYCLVRRLSVLWTTVPEILFRCHLWKICHNLSNCNCSLH